MLRNKGKAEETSSFVALCAYSLAKNLLALPACYFAIALSFRFRFFHYAEFFVIMSKRM